MEVSLWKIANSWADHWRAQPFSIATLLKKTCGLWQRPNMGVIKVNSDAAVGKNWLSVAVVARDWRGEVVFAYSKKINTTIPFQAEGRCPLGCTIIEVPWGGCCDFRI